MTKMNDFRRTLVLAGSIALLLPARGAEIHKAANVTPLTTNTSWVEGIVPTDSDIAVWNNTVVAANTSPFGGNLSFQGIKILNPTGNVILADNTAGNLSGNTLTLGSGGIDMSAATVATQIQSRILLSADQTWNVIDSNPGLNAFGFNFSEDLSFAAQTTNIPFDLGGFSVTKTGVGTTAITSGYVISNGTFNVNAGTLAISGASSRAMNVGVDVTFNVPTGGTLRFQGASGPSNVAGTINLNGGTMLMTSSSTTNGANVNGPVNVNAASTILLANPMASASTGPAVINGNITGSAPLNVTNTTTTLTFLRLAGDNSGYSGTITFGGTAGHASRLTSSSAGSATATWVVDAGHSLEVDGTNVQLGTLRGEGTITNSSTALGASITVGAGEFAGSIIDGVLPMDVVKTGPDTLLLTGFNSYTGPTTVNGGTLLVGTGGFGTSSVSIADGASFGVKVTSPGASQAVTAITVGTATGAAVTLDLGALGAPTTAPMFVGNLSIQAPTQLRVLGSNFTVGSFPLLGYSTISGLGVNGVTLTLPPRVLGTLSNAASQFVVNITGFDAPKWTGSVNGSWDIDTGGGSGTLNWREINSGSATRYIQSATGADSVLFDDTATGTTDVQITNTMLPNGMVVDNTTREYTFTGSGKISGGGGITKRGTGTLRIRNSGTNDYTGETTIKAGTLELGDGLTAGLGTLGTGAITNAGTLIFNRPDAFTIASMISSTGPIVKNGGAIALVSNAFNQTGPVTINGGGLTFGGGGSIGGAVSGSGILAVSGGVFELNGLDANTYTGNTVVNGGTLRLAKPVGVNAVSGNITITDAGVLNIVASEQIPDTATITFTGTSGDALAGSNGTETVANVIVNPSVPTGQLILRNASVVTGLATVQNGFLGIASGHSATINGINMSGGTVRLGGNTAPSTLNVGPGGITASGGVIEVKFTTSDQDAVLNLAGDFTATGNIAINNANYQGPNLSQIVLSGNRTFNIAAGTTTTVAPEISGTGGLIKTGTGTLDLVSRPATYTGDTIINGGTLRTATTQSGTSSIAIGDNANLSVRIPFAGTSLATQTMTVGSATGGTITFDLSGLGNPTAAPLTTGAFNASAGSSLVILGSMTAGTFPLIDYTNALGAGVFGNLTLKLPLRVAGSLVNNTADSRIDVTILGTDTPRWNGNVSTNWDIDDGSGTGTANWRGLFTGNPLRYLQSPTATDMVLFDDTAAVTNVNLTTNLTPLNATVNNTTKTYTFSGAGKLTGDAVLTKEGTGTLILANATGFDHTGGTLVNGGTLQIGDGVTPGVGVVPTRQITNLGTIVLNRPDDFDIFGTFDPNSSGGLTKSQANTASFATVANYPGPITLNAGRLRFIGGGNLAGVISGPGELVVEGGTLQLSGFEPNTYTGKTTVSGGTLQLNKAGVDAIGSTVEIQGSGVITFTQMNQIADNAKVIFNKAAGGQTIANETIGSLDIINGGEAAQMVANTGFVVNGLVTMTTGLFGIASNHSASVGGIDMSAGIVRIAANGGFSTLTVGPSGITASGGTIQVGQGAGAFDAILELRGNVTTTGFVNFTDGNFTGLEKRQIDLGDTTRVFNIAEFATTSIAPDIVGTGGLTKSGLGTLTLTSASASSYSGETNIQAGSLVLNGSLNGTSRINVRSGATFDVFGAAGGFSVNSGQVLAGSGTVAGDIRLLDGGKLSPGDTAGMLTLFTSSLDISLAIANLNSGALLFEIGSPGASDSVLLDGGSLIIGTGLLDFNDFAFAGLTGLNNASTYTLFDSSTPIVGTLGALIEGAINGAPFRLQFADNGNDLVLVPVPEPASAGLLAGAASLLGAFRRPRRRRFNQS
jgi:autotransporter-associated beta strand protein